MKKKLFAAVTVAAIPLLLTGCGGKKLTCTMKENNYEAKMSMVYKKDKLDSMKVTMTISDATEEQSKQTDLCKNFIEAEFTKDAVKSCKSSYKNKKITVNATLNVKKLSDDILSSKYDDAKKGLESSGYTCK